MIEPRRCIDCRSRRAGRLCVEHFADFLGWLTCIGPGAESLFWASARWKRYELVRVYADGAELERGYALVMARAA